VRRPGSGRQLRIIAFVIVVAAAAIAAAYFLIRPREEGYILRDYSTAIVEVRTIQDDLQLGGTVRVRKQATIRAPASGTLESLAVDVGDWITPGQLVAVLDAETLEDAYEAQKRNLVQSTRAHESMLLSQEQAQLNSSQDRRQLSAALEDAKDFLTDARELRKLGTITQAALEEAEEQTENAQRALDDHDAAEDISEKLRDLARQDSEDDLEAIREDIADLEAQLEDTQIASPMEGRVVWTIDAITAVGEPISPGTSIVQIANTRDPFVETVIEEQYIGDISLGEEAVVTIAGQELAGYIERIGLLATTPADGGAPTVELDLGVEAADLEVIPGSTALIELVVGVVPDALVLPRGPYLATGNRLYLYRIDGSTADRTPVTFGAVTERYVEIISGVSAGDEIITSSYQNYIDYESIDLGGGND
jgi:HlyD family secretion protein